MPDPSGRFGEFGGRYAPETLMAALAELEAAFSEAWVDPLFVSEYHRLLREFVGSPEPALRSSPPLRTAGNADPPQARRPQPHRCPQDQQHHRPGTAGQAHGQAADHRRDRCRPAWRRHRHRRRRPRPRMPGVHGGQRHGASGAQRRPDAAARYRGDPRHERSRHLERRRLRKRCATGSAPSRPPTTSSARWSALIRSRSWFGSSRR